MIPRTLLLARCRDGVVQPGLIEPQDTDLQALTERLRQIYLEAVDGPRWALEEALEAELSLCPQVKLARGIARVLEDRSTFESPDEVDSPAMRAGLFAQAAQARRDGGFDRAQLIAQAAETHGRATEQFERDLYADLPGEQLLKRVRDLSAVRLLQRYNLALVQAVLLDARSLELRIDSPSPRRLRQLLASLKFHRLLFAASWPKPSTLLLKVDGPMSLFESTRQYGLQMALFLPSLLLCERFSLLARLCWGKSRRSARLELDSDSGLVSHYPDRGMWLPPEVAAFPERFDALESGWRVGEAKQIFRLDGRGVAVPDLRFDPPAGGEPIYLELLGHWRKRSAEKQLKLIARHGPARYLVALSDKLCVEEHLPKLTSRRPPIWFKSVLIPRAVLKALEAV